MAKEYIYVDQEDIKQPVTLQKFKGLQYMHDCYILTITDENGNHEADFYVKQRTCYLLEQRNKSALQLHEVSVPRPRRGSGSFNVLFWLFCFSGKQYCDSRNSFKQKCEEFEASHPHLKVTVQDSEKLGTHWSYAFATGEGIMACLPVAYYYQIGGGAWAFYSKKIQYALVADLHSTLDGFKYPLQFVIYVFRGATMSYPNETREFFRGTLGCQYRNDVYYADLPGNF